MSPDWTFNLLEFRRLSTQSPSRVKSDAVDGFPSPTSQYQLDATAPAPHRTSIGKPTVTYGRLHLLGLPREIRLGVWRAIHYDVLLGSEELWFQHPSTAWDALPLTCRQIYIETADFWPCTILPQAKVDKAFTQVLSIELFANFRRLSLELNFNKGRDFFERLALSLSGLAQVLEDLRLFFTGNDKFNVKIFVHGCGLPGPGRRTSPSRLTIEGQHQHELKPIFFVLYFLERLRTLVIKNANYPLLQSMIIKHKLQLEYLHISTDPRSILHTEHDLEGKQQLVVSPRENFPPVKVLHISVNAALTALQVAAKVSRTLEEVNWTLPDISCQWHATNWLEQTTVMLDHFGTYASKLRIMRICLHAQLYEANVSEAALIGGLKTHLPRLASLETLELHIHSKADFSGREIIFAIPDSLKRLYVSDTLISPEQLEELITKRYLRNTKIERGGVSERWTSDTWIVSDNEGKPVPSEKAGFVPGNVQTNKNNRKGHWRKCGRESAFVCRDEIIGELRTRTDYIPYRHGKLGFIGYEYGGHREECGCGHCDNARLTMLRLNGRLLDREHNNHLGCFDGGLQISPRIHEYAAANVPMDTEPVVLDFMDDEAARKMEVLWKAVGEMAKGEGEENLRIGETRDFNGQATEEDVSIKLWREKFERCDEELSIKETEKPKREDFEQIIDNLDARKSGENIRHRGYFGMENQAREHFEKEMVVRVWEIRERRWPDDAVVGEKDHWLSEA